MVSRIKDWLEQGKEVRIFTARIYPGIYEEGQFTPLEINEEDDAYKDAEIAAKAIDSFCKKYIGQSLMITCLKDHGMVELWDDRAIQVEPNTGRPLAKRLEKPVKSLNKE